MKKRLKATAQRATRRDFVDDDAYDEEPNMRLSRAFFVVLVLHIVAVGGIFLFNKIQLGNQKPSTVESVAEAPPVTPAIAATIPATPVQQAAPATERRHFLRSGERLADVAAKYNVSLAELQTANGFKNSSEAKVGQSLIIPSSTATVAAAAAVPAGPVELQRIMGKPPVPPSHSVKSTPVSGGTSYVVEKGDNPHAIARAHGVNYNDLLKINNITDPKLLQIGQVLTIPPKK